MRITLDYTLSLCMICAMNQPSDRSPPYTMPTPEQVAAESAALRANLAAQYGEVMTTDETRAKYEIIGFAAPCVVVKRRSDGQIGTLTFTHMPRFYYDFVADMA